MGPDWWGFALHAFLALTGVAVLFLIAVKYETFEEWWMARVRRRLAERESGKDNRAPNE